MSKKTGKNILRIALSGAGGRMGQELQTLIQENKSLSLQAAVDKAEDWKKLKPETIDVVVDFSLPAGFSQALSWSVAHKKPLVSGTTGLSTADRAKLKKAGAQIPVLYSANMSLGIAVLNSMLQQLSMISDWDFQIEEAHHAQKKDKPSGTALLLQEKLTQSVGRQLPEPNAIRGGTIPGIHQVWAMGPEEALILQHTAFHRRVFARGALLAARWLFDKKQAGLYDLSDLYKT